MALGLSWKKKKKREEEEVCIWTWHVLFVLWRMMYFNVLNAAYNVSSSSFVILILQLQSTQVNIILHFQFFCSTSRWWLHYLKIIFVLLFLGVDLLYIFFFFMCSSVEYPGILWLQAMEFNKINVNSSSYVRIILLDQKTRNWECISIPFYKW